MTTYSVEFWSKTCLAPLLLAASAGANAAVVTFNFPSIMNTTGDGEYYDADVSTTPPLAKGTEKGVDAAIFAKSGIDVTFSAAGPNPSYVYLDANPFSSSATAPGSGIGVAGTTQASSEDEIAITTPAEVLFATFSEEYAITGLKFSQENNQALISDDDAQALVQISLDDGSNWSNYDGGGYATDRIAFRVDADADRLDLNNGNEFYLHELTVDSDFGTPFGGGEVPGPGSLALLGLGFGILGAATRRRRS